MQPGPGSEHFHNPQEGSFTGTSSSQTRSVRAEKIDGRESRPQTRNMKEAADAFVHTCAVKAQRIPSQS